MASRCMAWVSPAPLRSSAARAALREQALLLHLFRASYACAIAWTALLVWLGIGSGPPGACLGFSGALETVRRPRGASRARARRPPRSYICFGPVMSVPLPGPPCWFGWGLGQGLQVHALVFSAPSIPCAARAALRELRPLLHLFRASYVCAIAWTALVVRLEMGSGPPCACLGFFGALETVRRPRGASRASSAPTSVSGQLCL